MKNEKKPFEELLSELELVVKQLEEGNLPLEQTVALYEKGNRLGKECLAILDSYEGRVEKLIQKQETTEAGEE